MKATAIVVFLLINCIRLGLIMSKVQSTTTKELEPKVPVALKALGGAGELVMKDGERQKTMTSSSLSSRHSQSASRLFETRPCLL